MNLKLTLLVTISFLSLSAHAFKPYQYFIERPEKINVSFFTTNTVDEDIAYCEKIVESMCNGKNCDEEKNIQVIIRDSCLSTSNDKKALIEPPMGPVGFLPETYAGMSVFISQFRNLLLIPTAINNEQYEQYVSYFNEITQKYQFLDNENIKTTFVITGKYLEDKKNLKNSAYKEIHEWATDTMKERKFIDKQFSAIKLALDSKEKLNDFQNYNRKFLPIIAQNDAFIKLKDVKFSNLQCEAIFLNFQDDYISDLHKHTKFNCENPAK